MNQVYKDCESLNLNFPSTYTIPTAEWANSISSRAGSLSGGGASFFTYIFIINIILDIVHSSFEETRRRRARIPFHP